MASTDVLYDVVVVGAGVVGSATACQLARRGKRVLLLEQFPVPHTRGSSHGQSRIIRRAYPQTHYAEMMNECYDFWNDLEKTSGTSLMKETGMVGIAPSSDKYFDRTIKSFKRTNAPYELLNHQQLRRRFPHFRFDETYQGLFDPSAGVLKADRCVIAMKDDFKSKGGVFQDDTRMTSIVPGNVVRIVTNRGTYKGKSVVLTCGPWMKSIGDSIGLTLPLKPVRVLVCYWKGKRPGVCDADAPFPTFILPNVPDSKGVIHHYYGLAADEYPECAKICMHTGPEIDPDAREANPETWDLTALRELVAHHFPDCNPNPSIIEKCIYTVTPDEDFIVDTHPRWKNIAIGAGFSGHGFKTAPVIGRLLGELALGEQPSLDITPLRIGRFQQQQTKSRI